jgi:hypothetical protein
MTTWRGVNSANPFDVTAATATGQGTKATAPSITTISPKTRLLNVFGAGTADQPSFTLPVDKNGAGDETGAVKVTGGPKGATFYYAHLVGDRIQSATGPTSTLTGTINQLSAVPMGPDWTAISIALRP